MSKFSVTSTRRAPTLPESSPLHSKVAAAFASADFEVTRPDHAAQEATAAAARANSERAWVESAQADASRVWSDPAAALHSLKTLLAEAMRRDLARVAPDDAHARIRIRSGWTALSAQLESRMARAAAAAAAGATDAATVVSECLDTISVLGVWFHDLPSPAYGRRPQAILQMYYKYLENACIADDIAAFDTLHRTDTGRYASSSSSSSSSNKINKIDTAQFHTSPIAHPAFEQSPFVAQSRELRQLVTMRRVKLGELPPPPPVSSSANDDVETETETETEPLLSKSTSSVDSTATEPAVIELVAEQSSVIADATDATATAAAATAVDTHKPSAMHHNDDDDDQQQQQQLPQQLVEAPIKPKAINNKVCCNGKNPHKSSSTSSSTASSSKSTGNKHRGSRRAKQRHSPQRLSQVRAMLRADARH